MLSKLKLGFGRTLPLILQNEAAECGLACLGMVCGFYGRRFDMLMLRQRFSTTLKGATLAHLIDMANRLQLSSRALRLDLHELRELRLPCVLHWNLGGVLKCMLPQTNPGGVLKCMLINGGQTKSNGDTVYLRCGSSKYHLLSPLPWAEYKAKRQIRQ